MPKFILLHLQSNNSTVAVNVDTIHIVIKDYPANDNKKASTDKRGPFTCVYFNNNERIQRIFVNESVEKVYNMISECTGAPVALVVNDPDAK